MTNPPKVVVIDDELSDLTALADVLDRHGVPCRRIHYKGDPDGIMPCPDVRLVIANLSLSRGVLGTDLTANFSVLGTLLETAIRPSHPYAILLWTMHPDLAPELETFLHHLRGVPKPIEVITLAKADYLDSEGRVRDQEELKRQIETLAGDWIHPRGALALVGAWGELDDEEIDALVEDIYTARRQGVEQ